MQRTLRQLTLVTLATWGICVLYVGAVVLHLRRLGAPTHEVIPAFVWSVAGLLMATWIGFRSSGKLSVQAAAIIEFVLLVVGAALLVTEAIPRGWWAR